MSSTTTQLGINLLISLSAAAATVTIYDRWLLQPTLAIGTVDIAEIYRAKEAQFVQLLAAAGNEDERQHAFDMARSFSQRLPAALDELPSECTCLVLVRTAVIGSPRALDLTHALRSKVEQP